MLLTDVNILGTASLWVMAFTTCSHSKMYLMIFTMLLTVQHMRMMSEFGRAQQRFKCIGYLRHEIYVWAGCTNSNCTSWFSQLNSVANGAYTTYQDRLVERRLDPMCDQIFLRVSGGFHMYSGALTTYFCTRVPMQTLFTHSGLS